jgi:hypothetical protein
MNIADMCIPRTDFGTEVIDGKIFAIGGRDQITKIHDVEC